ncbi:hypothetical protein QFC19_001080 [Naganishia cerealis]|uniref:Uncharacterized protein n=1 Tax=Naganishia cerealis TaxID=610337 RepID=A0ACC2WKK8_9TREE|nr:hypothetical protein QFC19_001080 [Naganishia cerealis]
MVTFVPKGSLPVRFVDTEGRTLQEASWNDLSEDLSRLKLVLNEALDLRYSQEIHLEHERTPGFLMPVVDEIDYRGLIERLSSATSQQIVRVLVYNKTDGIPITPVRTPRTPSRLLVTPLPSTSTAQPALLSNSVLQAANTPTSTTVSTPRSLKKKNLKAVTEATGIAVPSPAKEVRFQPVQKSSLSTSTTAEDVMTQLEVAEDTGADSQVLEGTIQAAKPSESVTKKRKRSTEDDVDQSGTLPQAIAAQENVSKKSKKRKVNEANESVTSATEPSDSSISKERLSGQQLRRQKRLAALKELEAKAAEERALKMAQALVREAQAQSPSVAEPEAAATSELSQAAKRRQRRREKELAQKLALASVGNATQDAVMVDTSTLPSDSATDSPVNDTIISSEAVTRDAVDETSVALHVADSPVAIASVPNKESKGNKTLKGSATSDAVSASEIAEQGLATSAEPLIATQPGEAHPGSAANVSTNLSPVPETLPTTTRVAVEEQRQPAETKSNRKKRRESSRKSETRATMVVSEDPVSATKSVSTNPPAHIPAATSDNAPSSLFTAANDAATPSRKAKKQPRKSAAASALAEWRAQHAVSDAPGTVSVNAAAGLQNEAQEQLHVPLAQSSAGSAAESSSIEPLLELPHTQSHVIEDSNTRQQDREESSGTETPPASSAQIPLPSSSQRPARLPTSSPESYPSDSEESRDEWQVAHKRMQRMRTPDSDDVELEGEDDQENDPGEDVNRIRIAETPPDVISSFPIPVTQSASMEVDDIMDDEETSGRYAPQQQSKTPSPQADMQQAPEGESVETDLDEEVPSSADTVMTARFGTPNLFSSAQNPIIPLTQTDKRPSFLTLTDLAAPPSPVMPSTGVVAFQDAMEEDAAADQAAMDSMTAVEETSASDASANPDVQTNGVSVGNGLSIDSTMSQSTDLSQMSAASPRRLRSRMRQRDGSQSQNDQLKLLPLPAPTPKKKGRPTKTVIQSEKAVSAGDPVATQGDPVPTQVDPISTQDAASAVNGHVESGATPISNRRERRIAASQSRIPALSSLSADALRKGRASRFSTTGGPGLMNGSASQPNPTRVLAPNTQSAVNTDSDEEAHDDTDTDSDTDDEQQTPASSLPANLVKRVAGGRQPRKPRQSLGQMQGW